MIDIAKNQLITGHDIAIEEQKFLSPAVFARFGHKSELLLPKIGFMEEHCVLSQQYMRQKPLICCTDKEMKIISIKRLLKHQRKQSE